MMLKTSIFLFFIFLSFCGFSQFVDSADSKYKVYFFEDGTISSEGFLKDGKPNDYWITYYENGLRKSEGNRENFELNGVWKFYRENGNIKNSIAFKEGIKQGKSITYNNKCYVIRVDNYENNLKEGNSFVYFPDSSNSMIKKVIPFENDKESGLGYEYAKDGRLIHLYTYKNGFLSSKESINKIDKQGRKQGIWKSYYKNLRLKLENRYKNDLLNGYSKYYSNDGKLDSAILYINGEKQSNEDNQADFNLEYNYFKNGQVKSIAAYNLEGKKDGVTTEFDTEGNVVSTKLYKNDNLLEEGIIDKEGKKQGKWKTYYLTGELKSEGSYSNAFKKGKWVFYFRNGSIEQEGFYDAAGRYTGKWKWYYENGKILRTEEFRKGLEDGYLEEFDIIGNFITKGEYIDGEKEGEWFYELNDHKEEGKYRYGQRNGYWEFNYPNGKPSFEGNYVDGQPEGTHKYYYESGILEREENYSYGLKDGKWKWYNTFGEETLTILYKDDVEKKIDGKKVKSEKK